MIIHKLLNRRVSQGYCCFETYLYYKDKILFKNPKDFVKKIFRIIITIFLLQKGFFSFSSSLKLPDFI